MKKMTITVSKMMMVALALIMISSMAFAAVNPKIEITEYSFDKTPVTAGNDVTLTLRLKSVEWDQCAERVRVQIITPYPFSVRGLDTKYLGTLCLQTPEQNGSVSFDLPVDSLGEVGTYPISVVVTYEKWFEKFTDSHTLNIQVGGTPHLSTSAVSSEPLDIYPGDRATIETVLTNDGKAQAESVHVEFSSPDGIEIKWAGENQDIGSIAPRAHGQAYVSIEAPKNLPSGNYTIREVVTYLGTNNFAGTQEFNITIPIKPKAEFTMHTADETAVFAGSNKEIAVIVKNTGSDTAKNMKVRLQPIFPFSTDGTVRYVDELKPGQEATLHYKIHTDTDATLGEQVNGALFEFEDADGKKFTDTEDFALTVKEQGIIDSIVSYWYVIAIICIIIVLRIRGAKKKP